MKVTKSQLRKIIEEELSEAMARPAGGAVVEPSGPLVIMGTSGTFNVDILDGQFTLTGQLDSDVVEDLLEGGVIQDMGHRR